MKPTTRRVPPSVLDPERAEPLTLGVPAATPRTRRAPQSVDAGAFQALGVRPAATKSAPRSVKRST